ncbi:hypothetical protein [Mycolicibacterium parafortuitum]|uniref:hypothetical protein n=1 Tax=Mycolicibacterium parafortuitum TaxID=39692 RepID=UPI0032C4504A
MVDWLEILKVAPTAAVVSAAVTVVIRWLDRPRAVLRMEGRLTAYPAGVDVESSGAGDGPTVSGRLALVNVGDGDAFDVKVFGSKCDPAILTEPGNWVYSIPVIKAGESAIVTVAGNADQTKTQAAAVIVTWSPRPRRWIRSRLRVRFTDLGFAELLPPGAIPVAEIPSYVRRTRKLEALSPRAKRYLQREQAEGEQ